MKIVIQRVSEASVSIDGEINGQIEKGFVILTGICEEDTQEDISWLSKKVIGLRVFSDEEGKMNLSIKDVGGSILLISQFTLHASTKKGNRPSFIHAAKPAIAIPLYEAFLHQLSEEEINVQTGKFGADKKVSLINDGPVTIIIDSKNKV